MRFHKTKALIIALLFVACLLAISPIEMARAQTTNVSVTPQNSTPAVGQTLKVDISISNVQNLYGIDITLDWDSSVLQFVSADLHLGDQASGGVLNGNPVSTNPQSGGVFVTQNGVNSASQYEIVATSENPAGPFSGSGNVVTLTFTVLKAGHSSLTVTPQLASYVQPGSGDTSEPISTTVTNSAVDAGSTSGTSSPGPTSPSTSPSSTSTLTPTFVGLLIIGVLVIIIVVVVVVVLLLRNSLRSRPSVPT